MIRLLFYNCVFLHLISIITFSSCFSFSRLHQIWLMYYYTTLSLRENILYSNGSNIQPWWIYHHYLSLLISLIMLVWPSESLLLRSTELLYFGLFQGLVMLAQNIYQKRRSYVRKSLGKAKQVDVDTSETLVEKPTDLKVLIPLLYALYVRRRTEQKETMKENYSCISHLFYTIYISCLSLFIVL